MSTFDAHGNLHAGNGRFAEQNRPDGALSLSPADVAFQASSFGGGAAGLGRALLHAQAYQEPGRTFRVDPVDGTVAPADRQKQEWDIIPGGLLHLKTTTTPVPTLFGEPVAVGGPEHDYDAFAPETIKRHLEGENVFLAQKVTLNREDGTGPGWALFIQNIPNLDTPAADDREDEDDFHNEGEADTYYSDMDDDRGYVPTRDDVEAARKYASAFAPIRPMYRGDWERVTGGRGPTVAQHRAHIKSLHASRAAYKEHHDRFEKLRAAYNAAHPEEKPIY